MRVWGCAAVALLFGLGLLPGCATGYLEVIPERLYEQRPWSRGRVEKRGELHVVQRGFSLFSVPVSIPDLALAIDAAIQDAGADGVSNLEVVSAQSSFFLFAWSTYTARGDLVVEGPQP